MSDSGGLQMQLLCASASSGAPFLAPTPGKCTAALTPAPRHCLSPALQLAVCRLKGTQRLQCRHSSRFLSIWLSYMPWDLWRACHWAMVPVAGIVAYLLLSIEEIGVQMEVDVQLVGCCYSITRLEQAVQCNAELPAYFRVCADNFSYVL